MLIQADARRIPLVDGCVQCCVTSPPYFALRDYGHTEQIGQEDTPSDYVQALVDVFSDVWRVMADDGTLWLNLGDSYATRGGENQTPQSGDQFQRCERGKNVICRSKRVPRGGGRRGGGNAEAAGTIKPKDLIGIPWRVAFALQSAGWYLRSDIIWAKPNPMPESVTDRPTKAHEYVFLLSKAERYYYDADAIREVGAKPAGANGTFGNKNADARRVGELTGNMRDGMEYLVSGYRNVRSVWTINPKPYAGAHFATMPEKLAERCILAGSRPGDLVLDPFGGSGTTVRVARRFNRRGVMLDLNPKYLQLAAERISGVQTDIFEVPA